MDTLLVTRKRLLARWLLALAALAALVLLSGRGYGIPCPVYSFTRLYCPGCGSMRAIASLARFELADALRYNAPVVAVLPVLAFLLGRDTLRLWQGRPAKSDRAGLPLALGMALLFGAFAVARNLPALAWLAPGGAL